MNRGEGRVEGNPKKGGKKNRNIKNQRTMESKQGSSLLPMGEYAGPGHKSRVPSVLVLDCSCPTLKFPGEVTIIFVALLR